MEAACARLARRGASGCRAGEASLAGPRQPGGPAKSDAKAAVLALPGHHAGERTADGVTVRYRTTRSDADQVESATSSSRTSRSDSWVASVSSTRRPKSGSSSGTAGRAEQGSVSSPPGCPSTRRRVDEERPGAEDDVREPVRRPSLRAGRRVSRPRPARRGIRTGCGCDSSRVPLRLPRRDTGREVLRDETWRSGPTCRGAGRRTSGSARDEPDRKVLRLRMIDEDADATSRSSDPRRRGASDVRQVVSANGGIGAAPFPGTGRRSSGGELGRNSARLSSTRRRCSECRDEQPGKSAFGRIGSDVLEDVPAVGRHSVRSPVGLARARSIRIRA